jgi:hypothetical protein
MRIALEVGDRKELDLPACCGRQVQETFTILGPLVVRQYAAITDVKRARPDSPDRLRIQVQGQASQ